MPGSGGERYHQLLFREPTVLTHGKKMSALSACAVATPGLALLGRRSGVISIFHQCHDRGVTHSFRAALSGHCNEKYSSPER
eukprot:5707824-Amphidinium_carterae.1